METHGIVYIVDDDPWMRESTRLIVGSVGLEARAYPDAAAFLRDDKPQCPACLILDLRMPGTSGFELLESLRAQGMALPVIMVTGYGDLPTAVRAMKSGAADFLEKPFREQALLDLVQRCLEQDARQRQDQALRAEARARLARLSEREKEVLVHLVAGHANKVIAAELGISERTVEAHRAV